MIELKPCPFCGSVHTQIHGATVFYAICTDCEASSGCYDNRQEAIDAWNKRSNEQEGRR